MKSYPNIPASQEKVAEFRLEVIEFLEEFGLPATQKAFKVSKSTLYRWRKKFKESKGRLASLAPLSTKPKAVRERRVEPMILGYISKLRKDHYRLGKEKIKVFLDQYCFENDLAPISSSTIGRIIKSNQFFFQRQGRAYHNPSSGWAKGKRKKAKRLRVKHPRKLKEADFGHLQMDTIVKFIDGMKLYLLTAIDVKLKFSFSLPYTRLNSANALSFFKRLEQVYPLKGGIKSVQTDNGLEFLGLFDQYLKKKKVPHFFIYPRCPRINGVVERFNRTLQEEFFNPHSHLVHHPQEFHAKLGQYLIWYNTQRPHQALGQKSPMNYLLESGHLSHMYWTYTHK